MSGVNKVILIGNLGADPEVRFTQNGTAVANLRLATNERYKDRNGEWQERTEWHRVVCFGRTAEVCQQYLKKGRQIYIEGRLQTREWEDQSGNRRFTTEVVATTMQMLGGRGGGGDDFVPNDAPAAAPAAGAPSADDDLPF